jgi:hypothetical protein
MANINRKINKIQESYFKRGSVPPRCTLGSAVFPEFFYEKRLELKSLKGRTKAEEDGRQLKPPYKFTYLYGGTPEPQTA